MFVQNILFVYNGKIQIFDAGFYKIHEVEFELDLNFVSIFTHHADKFLSWDFRV